MINRFRDVVGDKEVDNLTEMASSLSDTRFLHVNSTRFGGGVAEILSNALPIYRSLGINMDWRTIMGDADFFNVTKCIHNALHGGDAVLTEDMIESHLKINRLSAESVSWDHDFKIVHDPQPLPIISFAKKGGHWLWRCHIDLTGPNKQFMDYALRFIQLYDHIIVSLEQYKININIPQHVIQPAINPLSDKNKLLPEEQCKNILKHYGLELDRPIIAQVSRFDRWKNPFGLVEMFEQIKNSVDCRLVFVGNFSVDDPEGSRIWESLIERTRNMEDVYVISETDRTKNDILVNAVQRASTIIFQNSLREGFGLTVSEALWKGTPVIGGNCGGIPSQIIHGMNGYLIDSKEEGVRYALKLLRDDRLRENMGRNAVEHVRNNFLITRYIKDYLALFNNVA